MCISLNPKPHVIALRAQVIANPCHRPCTLLMCTVHSTTPYGSHVAFDHTAANVHPEPPYPQTPTPSPRIDTPAGALPPTTPSSLYTYPSMLPSNTPVFTGIPDCKILVEDWVRDMQYLLETIELPPHTSAFPLLCVTWAAKPES